MLREEAGLHRAVFEFALHVTDPGKREGIETVGKNGKMYSLPYNFGRRLNMEYVLLRVCATLYKYRRSFKHGIMFRTKLRVRPSKNLCPRATWRSRNPSLLLLRQGDLPLKIAQNMYWIAYGLAFLSLDLRTPSF